MSTEENKAIVLKFYQAFDNRNIEQADPKEAGFGNN
jgi:hypothetical protein